MFSKTLASFLHYKHDVLPLSTCIWLYHHDSFSIVPIFVFGLCQLPFFCWPHKTSYLDKCWLLLTGHVFHIQEKTRAYHALTAAAASSSVSQSLGKFSSLISKYFICKYLKNYINTIILATEACKFHYFFVLACWVFFFEF